MTIELARTIGQTLGVRSETKYRVLDAALRQYVRSVAQSPLVEDLGSIDAAQVISGEFADARISESSVTQHEAALEIDWSQLTNVPATFPPEAHNHAASEITSGTFADARVAESNVTQHEAALEIDWSQLTSVPSTFPPDAHLTHGTWTPVDASGAGLAFASVDGVYTIHEDLLIARCRVLYPATADTSGAEIGGLPFAGLSTEGNRQGFVSFTSAATCARALPRLGVAQFRLYDTTGAQIQNVAMSGKSVYATLIYQF